MNNSLSTKKGQVRTHSEQLSMQEEGSVRPQISQLSRRMTDRYGDTAGGAAGCRLE